MIFRRDCDPYTPESSVGDDQFNDGTSKDLQDGLMSSTEFAEVVDGWIGSRTYGSSPLEILWLPGSG